jgi:tetratricopeptide (TPR) repeat protein
MKSLMVGTFTIAVHMVFIAGLIPPATAAESFPWIDSAAAQYGRAGEQYDSVMLRQTVGYIERHPNEERQTPGALLTLGLVYWRLELIAFCKGDNSGVSRWGSLAIDKLNEAEKGGADVYLTASHKALASQLLASLGMLKGAKYGPRAASELKKAQKANPQGYFTFLVEAVNANRAPSFVGGSLKKAVELFEKMAKTFPDSIDVKIHLADAYIQLDRMDEAEKLILPIVETAPSNLLAKKIAARLKIKK